MGETGAEDGLDLGFVPKGGKLSAPPRYNTSRLELGGWMQTCDGVLAELGRAQLLGTSQDFKNVVERILVSLENVEDSVPIKLCMRYFEDSRCLKVLVSQVLKPLI